MKFFFVLQLSLGLGTIILSSLYSLLYATDECYSTDSGTEDKPTRAHGIIVINNRAERISVSIYWQHDLTLL